MKHECRECGMEVIHNSRTLEYHFRNRHNLDVLNYYKKHIDPVAGEGVANLVKLEVKEEPLDVAASAENDPVQAAQALWITFEYVAARCPTCRFLVLFQQRTLR